MNESHSTKQFKQILKIKSKYKLVYTHAQNQTSINYLRKKEILLCTSIDTNYRVSIWMDILQIACVCFPITSSCCYIINVLFEMKGEIKRLFSNFNILAKAELQIE